MRTRAPDPDFEAITRAFLHAGALFVVIGGFAVIANDYVRATEDVDLLIPDDDGNDLCCTRALEEIEAVWNRDDTPVRRGSLAGVEHARLVTRVGLVDLLREGPAPLDYVTVAASAIRADLGDGEFRLAGLRSLVSFKRLADRPRDRLDLEELRRRHGELPIERIPGLDP